jgi:hypothetical protein
MRVRLSPPAGHSARGVAWRLARGRMEMKGSASSPSTSHSAPARTAQRNGADPATLVAAGRT